MAVEDMIKNSMEVIRFQITEYRGKPYADVRVFYRDVDDKYKPSKKGLTISPEIWLEFVQRIEELSEQMEAQGLLEAEGEE